jgi:hypothetical protein
MASIAKTKSKTQTKAKTTASGKLTDGAQRKKSLARRAGGSGNANSASATHPKARVVNKISAPHTTAAERKLSKGLRVPQYTYMKAPGVLHDFQVGDTVEVFCDHEKNRDRIRGWIGGIVVQVDYKMVAVQFRSNVFLTDGWMVPDRILWYPLTSEHIRPVLKKSAKREKAIPDY